MKFLVFYLFFLLTMAANARSTSYDSLDNLLPYFPHGWFNPDNDHMLSEMFKTKSFKTVIEVGSWLGNSTTFFANHIDPSGKVYAVDTWLGSAEHHNDPEVSYLLDNLYEQFLSNMIHAKIDHIVVPVRGYSTEVAKELDVKADLIYLDGAHDEESVYQDIISWADHLNENGLLCGDDWWLSSVQKGVTRAADQLNKKIQTYGVFWWFE